MVRYEDALGVVSVHRPPHPTPTSAALRAAYLAGWGAIEYPVDIITSSKTVVRCCAPLRWTGELNNRGKPAPLDGGGGTFSCREDAINAGWLIYWQSEGLVTVSHGLVPVDIFDCLASVQGATDLLFSL